MEAIELLKVYGAYGVLGITTALALSFAMFMYREKRRSDDRLIKSLEETIRVQEAQNARFGAAVQALENIAQRRRGS